MNDLITAPLNIISELVEIQNFLQVTMSEQGKKVFPCLIICPSSLKLNWADELNIWVGENALILDNKTKTTWHRFYELGMNNFNIMICNIQAAGVGHNFSAAHEVGFVEYPWTASDCFQCEDRVFDTKKPNPMVCTYFLGHKTIDEDNYELIKSKAGMSNAVTGSTDEMATEFIDKVINSLGIK